MPVGIAALAFKAGQPHTSGGVADNTLDQSLEQRRYALNLQRVARLDRLVDAVKFLLDTDIGEGADSQFGGQIGTDAVLGDGSLPQLIGKADIAGGSRVPRRCDS